MLKSVYIFIITTYYSLIDYIAPERKNYTIVSHLSAHDLELLPRGPEVATMPWIFSLFHYKHTQVKAIVWELKYKENTKLLPDIGQKLFEEILTAVSDIILFDSDALFYLVPIPITNKRRSERGFNQSEYIAKAIREHDTHHILIYAPQYLQKTKETTRQSHTMSRAERLSNLSGSFSADPRVENAYIILIDDVTTTGSTLSEARKTLLSAGARDVLAYTIAH